MSTALSQPAARSFQTLQLVPTPSKDSGLSNILGSNRCWFKVVRGDVGSGAVSTVGGVTNVGADEAAAVVVAGSPRSSSSGTSTSIAVTPVLGRLLAGSCCSAPATM